MVNLTPDPPREPTLPGVENSAMVILTDSDDDEPYEGYDLLPTDIEEIDLVSEEEELQEVCNDGDTEDVRPSTFDQGLAEDLKQVWEKPAQIPKEEMDPQLKEEVLKAMQGFTLPPSAIPPWASEVREEDWKNHLLEKLKADQ